MAAGCITVALTSRWWLCIVHCCLQATFTHDAIVVSLGVYCGQFSGADDERAFLSVVYAYSKQALYATPAARSAAGGPTNPHENNQHQQQQQPASGKQSSTLKASPASTPPPQIYAATYLSSGSWYRSVPLAGQAAVDDAYKPFNSFIQPARPQAVEDMARAPLLVMKVGRAYDHALIACCVSWPAWLLR